MGVTTVAQANALAFASLERKVDDLLAATGKIDTIEQQLSCLCRHFQVSLAVADDTDSPSHAKRTVVASLRGHET